MKIVSLVRPFMGIGNLVIHSSPKALAPVCTCILLEKRRTNDHHTINSKSPRGATKSHPYLARNPDNGTVVVRSKAIRKLLYIGRIVFYHKSKQSKKITWLITTCDDVEHKKTCINWAKAPYQGEPSYKIDSRVIKFMAGGIPKVCLKEIFILYIVLTKFRIESGTLNFVTIGAGPFLRRVKAMC